MGIVLRLMFSQLFGVTIEVIFLGRGIKNAASITPVF